MTGPRRAAARARPRRRRRRDGPGRAARAGGGRGAPDPRAPARALARGRHAASDYLETAALAGVVTIGCRRCGGGLAGAVGSSNVLAGAELAAARSPDLVVFDGQRRRAAADRDEPPRARRERAPGAGAPDRVPERVPDPRLRPRRPDHGRGGQRVAGSARGDLRADRRRPSSRSSCVRARSSPSQAGASPSSRPRRRRRCHGSPRTWPRRTAPTSSTQPRQAPRVARRAGRARRGGVRRRAQGRRDRRRRRGGRARRGIPVVFADNEVVPASRRGRSRRRARGARPRRRRRPGAPAVSQPRYRQPLPLGGEDGLPYSKGLMARALMAAGVARRARVRARAPRRDRARRHAAKRASRSSGCASWRSRRSAPRRAEAMQRCDGYRELRRARPADHPPRRRRDRHRQVDRRDRGRAPARDHARHLDRLRPPDDARVLLPGVHAVDPLLELRGRRGAAACPRTRRIR